MANNRTGRGVLILMFILAMIVAGIYLGRRSPHPLDIETQHKALTTQAESVDSTGTASEKKTEKKRRKKSANKPVRTKHGVQPIDLPSPHDSPVSTIN